jgi:hypothetical protein
LKLRASYGEAGNPNVGRSYDKITSLFLVVHILVALVLQLKRLIYL